MKNLLYGLLLVSLIISCNSGKKENTLGLSDEVLSTPSIPQVDKAYRVKIPAGWTTQDTIAFGFSYYFLYPPKSDHAGNTSINIIQESAQQLGLNDYRSTNIRNMQKQLSGFEVSEQGDFEAGNLKGVWFYYTMGTNEPKPKLFNYTIIDNNVAYTITGGTPADKANYYQSIFDSVARSFRLLK